MLWLGQGFHGGLLNQTKECLRPERRATVLHRIPETIPITCHQVGFAHIRNGGLSRRFRNAPNNLSDTVSRVIAAPPAFLRALQSPGSKLGSSAWFPYFHFCRRSNGAKPRSKDFAGYQRLAGSANGTLTFWGGVQFHRQPGDIVYSLVMGS